MIRNILKLLEASMHRVFELLVQTLALFNLMLYSIIFVEKDVLLLTVLFHRIKLFNWILLLSCMLTHHGNVLAISVKNTYRHFCCYGVMP